MNYICFSFIYLLYFKKKIEYNPYDVEEMRNLYRELRIDIWEKRKELRLLEKEKRSKKQILNTAWQEKYKNKEFKTLKEMEIWVEWQLAELNARIAKIEADILEKQEWIQALKMDLDWEKTNKIIDMQEEKDLALND